MAKKVEAQKKQKTAAIVRDNSPDKTRAAEKKIKSAANPPRNNSPDKTRSGSSLKKETPKKSSRSK